LVYSNIADLSRGIYLMKITSDEKQPSKSLLRTRALNRLKPFTKSIIAPKATVIHW